MRIANLRGRLVLIDETGALDVETASQQQFTADPQAVYERWQEFRGWADAADLPPGVPFDEADLLPPTPTPRQIFAIGLNYREHAVESGMEIPKHPMVFTKFASCLTGARAEVALPAGGANDWEIELVVVIGKRAERVPVEQAWEYVAGLTVGQDLSERGVQYRDPVPQFNIGKSLPGFGPLGPVVVTTDELADPDDLELVCLIDGQEVQRGRTKDMVFTVPELISRLSHDLPLLPGDIIFTGTPSGIGAGMKPMRFLAPGETLISRIEGIGELRNHLVSREG